MLLCCIIPSSSGKNQRSAQEIARRISGAVVGEAYARSSQDLDSRQRAISGAVAGESTQKSTYQVPITISISRITLFAICLSFSSPPLHPCRFIRPLFPFPFSFSICLFCFFACFLVCWIACLSRWLKIILNCVTLPIPTILILLSLWLLLLPMMNLVRLIPPC